MSYQEVRYLPVRFSSCLRIQDVFFRSKRISLHKEPPITLCPLGIENSLRIQSGGFI